METRIVYSLVLFLAGLIAVFISSVAFRNRHRIAGAVDFCFLLAGCVCYSFGYVWELWSGGLGPMLMAIRFEYLGIAFIPSLWLLFCLSYAGHRPSRAVHCIVLLYSVLTWCVVATAPFHSLYYVGLNVRVDGPFPILAFGRGPWYYVHQAYLWASVLAGDAVLLLFLRTAPRAFKGQILLVLVATVFPLAMNAVYLSGAVPYGLDVGPLSFFFSFALLALALFKFHFLDLMPFAREKVLEALEDGVLVVDAEDRLVDSNPAARGIFGESALKNGRSLGELCGQFPALSPFLGTDAREAEFSIERGSGDSRRYRARACPIGERQKRRLGTAFLFTDVTKTAELVARLDILASTDGLTGLFNRRHFFELAQRELDFVRRSWRPICVCIADLDHFKEVNDRYGHAAGDEVLREAALRFRACLRSTDLVCRYGGEEFAFLFPDCGMEAGVRAAERLREALASAPVEACGERIAVTGSFGICGLSPASCGALDLLFGRADEALYRAKEEGRNRVVQAEPGP
jgi:diguanylate cyclase (GGDEF)-like protein